MLCLCISRLLSLKMMTREVLHHRSNKNVSKAVFYHHMLEVKQFTFDAFILYLWLPTWSKVTISLQRKRKILEYEDKRFKCTAQRRLCAGSCFCEIHSQHIPNNRGDIDKEHSCVRFYCKPKWYAGRALRMFAMRLVWQRVLWDNLASLSCTFHYHLMNHHFHIW